MLDAELAIADGVLALVGLVLAVLALRLLARAVLVAPGVVGTAARRSAAALRPGLVRRVAAGVVGLATPLLATSVPAHASAPALAPAAASGATPRADDLPPRAPRTDVTTYVVVVRGDTLWDLARTHLPRGAGDAAVAHEWPRWYAANRALIGSDPNLIRPGMRLRVPDRRPTGTSSPSSTAPARSPSAGATPFDPDRR